MGIVTEAREVHPEKVQSLMAFTEVGTTTFVRERQLSKAATQIVVTEVGMVTEVSCEQ